jgi:hypothetical protein
MRAYVLLALALLAVSSCDSNNPAPKQATVVCNCATPQAPAALTAPEPTVEPMAPHRAGHHRVAGRHGPNYRSHREYADAAVFTYNYHSDSHSYYQGEPRGHRDGHDGSGYILPANDAQARMQPWHGYDVDCPDDKR